MMHLEFTFMPLLELYIYIFQALCSAVVQVFLAEPPSLNRWNKRCCGVATLVKDNPVRSYYIRVYDIRVSWL